MLEVSGVSVSFGGVHALKDVSFSLADVPVGALIGPNGAGKTTMFNVCTGFVTPTRGSVTFDGAVVSNLAPHEVFRTGIARTFQNLNLIGELTIRENLYLAVIGAGRPSTLKGLLRLSGKFWKEHDALVEECLTTAGVQDWQHKKAASLPYGILKNAELARALVARPKMLLLDEPAAGLNNTEKDRLAGIIRNVADSGLRVLMVEHDMPFVSSLADYVVCLNFGQVIASGTFSEVQKNKDVIAAYLGESDA